MGIHIDIFFNKYLSPEGKWLYHIIRSLKNTYIFTCIIDPLHIYYGNQLSVGSSKRVGSKISHVISRKIYSFKCYGSQKLALSNCQYFMFFYAKSLKKWVNMQMTFFVTYYMNYENDLFCINESSMCEFIWEMLLSCLHNYSLKLIES